MESWLNKPSSLNWVNKKKLTQQIQKFEQTVVSLEERLLELLSDIHDWKHHAKVLTKMSNQQQLTANHIVHLRPLLQQSEDFQKALNLLGFDKDNLVFDDD